MAPVRLGQWVSLKHYARRSRAWDEVAPNVWLGRCLTEREAEEAVRHGVVAVVDVTCELAEARAFLDCRYLGMPVMDLTAPTGEQLARAAEFIAENVGDGVVYVHCKAGYSRSAAVVGAYLLSSGIVGTAEEAVARIRERRGGVILRGEVVRAIGAFAEGGGWKGECSISQCKTNDQVQMAKGRG